MGGLGSDAVAVGPLTELGDGQMSGSGDTRVGRLFAVGPPGIGAAEDPCDLVLASQRRIFPSEIPGCRSILEF
jgi:hypothetical protein